MDRANEAIPQVLLVDDEPLILSSYGRTLRSLEIDVLLAEGPEEGLRVLESQPIDVVIADYRMPGMNGDEFLERVRERWPDTVRMLNTAYADVEVVEEVVRRGGIFRFLTKPCDPQKLKSAVLDSLRQRSVLQERKVRSEKLQLDLQSFMQIFHSALDPMMVSDLDGHLVEVNEAFVKNKGVTREEALRGSTLLEGWIREDRWPAVRQVLLSEGHWSDELASQDDDRHALVSVSVVRDEEREPFALVAIEKDVTLSRRLERELRAAQYEVILSLAKLAEYRDPETFAHLERMRRYSQILARKLAETAAYSDTIDEEYIEAIFVSSPLHDVGKVGIPDSVLLKPGKLTDEEWRIMQLHTRIGAKILSSAGSGLSTKTWLAMAHTIALQHHEKVDGTGYPHGLKGDEIDLAARIVALADAYDAITSKRVYKDAFSHEEARQRVLESSGTHFDEDVVQAFLDAEQEFLDVISQFSDPSVDEGALDTRAGVLARIERLLGAS
jgi:PAS domain S-box-containing protein